MTPSRAERLGEAIKAEVSDIIQRELRDPRIGFVSITEVVVSQDLRHAKIFVSVLGDDDAKRRSMQGLERAQGRVRSALGARLRIRYVPEVLFRLDTSIERGSRVVALMRTVAEEETGGSSSGHRSDPQE